MISFSKKLLITVLMSICPLVSMSKQTGSPLLDNLPHELLTEILKRTDVLQRSQLRTVCSQFNKAMPEPVVEDFLKLSTQEKSRWLKNACKHNKIDYIKLLLCADIGYLDLQNAFAGAYANDNIHMRLLFNSAVEYLDKKYHDDVNTKTQILLAVYNDQWNGPLNCSKDDQEIIRFLSGQKNQKKIIMGGNQSLSLLLAVWGAVAMYASINLGTYLYDYYKAKNQSKKNQPKSLNGNFSLSSK